MQLITVLSAASAMVATASASTAVQLNQECDTNKAYARVVNRCEYPVYIWSIYIGEGCPTTEAVTLKKGETYNENLQDPKDGVTGISIKISKTEQCDPNELLQFEYFLEKRKVGYEFNYLDVSYVNCQGGNCPTKQEGYHMISGSQSGANKANAANAWCPVLACGDAATCATMSYINPGDPQTKTCNLDQNMELHLCGGEAPSGNYGSAPAASSAAPSAPAYSPVQPSKPLPTSVKDTYGDSKAKVEAAAVTPVAEVKDDKSIFTKVDYVYVTQTEYVNSKRHAHGHARRHQLFHA